MDLLLTSAGITTPGIRARLEELLGRPVAECAALCIPTAMYGHPHTGPRNAWQFVSGREPECPMTELGWRSVGLLELTALPSLPAERWQGWLREADVLLVAGGDALYLAHWLRESGVADLLPELTGTLWVGMSAGSMALTPHVGREFVGWQPPSGSDAGLGLVDFSLFPHLDNPQLPSNTLDAARRWASVLPTPAYAIDDSTALSVVGGEVEVISSGTWHRFEPGGPQAG